jgi:hypothetical protein
LNSFLDFIIQRLIPVDDERFRASGTYCRFFLPL